MRILPRLYVRKAHSATTTDVSHSLLETGLAKTGCLYYLMFGSANYTSYHTEKRRNRSLPQCTCWYRLLLIIRILFVSHHDSALLTVCQCIPRRTLCIQLSRKHAIRPGRFPLCRDTDDARSSNREVPIEESRELDCSFLGR